MSRIATVLCAVVACLSTALSAQLAPSATAATVLFAGGTGGSLGELLQTDAFGTHEDLLGGSYQDDSFQVVDYPSSLWPITGLHDLTFGKSVAVGAVNVEWAIRSTAGPVVVVGVSQGGIAVQTAMAKLNEDTRIPNDLTFVVIASPNSGLFRTHYGEWLPIFDYWPEPQPETRFKTVVVVNEYDGWADPVSNPLNLWTVANAFMGMIYVHPFAQNSDLSSVPSENIVVETNDQGGTTSRYLVPTEQLPLTMPLRIAGLPVEFVDFVDDVMRPVIDAGYARQIPEPQVKEYTQESKNPLVRSMEDQVRGTGKSSYATSPRSAKTRSNNAGLPHRVVANYRPAATA